MRTDTKPVNAAAALRRLLSARRYADAVAAAAALRERSPQDPAGWLYGGIALLEQRSPRESLPLLEQAVALQPDNPSALAQLARARVLSGQLTAALEPARRALACDPTDALTLDTLGVVFSHAGSHVDAADTFRRAVAAHPGNPAYLHNLGNALKFCGDRAGARDAFESALRINPALAQVHYALAQLQRWSVADNHVAALEQQLSGSTGDSAAQLYLGHALAKELDDLDRCDRAFSVLQSVNAAWRRQHPYDPATDRAIVQALVESFTVGHGLPEPTGPATGAPVFIVGMPRTGTTLVERILASHPDITAGGELPFGPQCAHRLNTAGSIAGLNAAAARSLPAIDPARLRVAYLQQAGTVLANASRFTDKLPLNFLYAGVLLRAFPDARMICLRRHPLDTCLGNFRQLFALENTWYAYSQDILDCGRYYLLFDRLMRHWQSLFPGRILELHYERLVQDQAAQTRSLLEFCSLPWNTACLDFASNPMPVATASSTQVREPLNRHGLQRWQRYRQALQPLRALLEDGGIHCGTSD